MSVKMILAVDNNFGIGYKNKLPWNVKEDIDFFKKITEGSIVIMGRKTFESIGNKPLTNRYNVVVTSKDMSKYDYGNVIFLTFEQLKEKLTDYTCTYTNIFIIGGKRIYESLIGYCKEIILTHIDDEYETDVKINEKIFKDFKIDKKEYLSDKVNVIYYYTNKPRKYNEPHKYSDIGALTMTKYGLYCPCPCALMNEFLNKEKDMFKVKKLKINIIKDDLYGINIKENSNKSKFEFYINSGGIFAPKFRVKFLIEKSLKIRNDFKDEKYKLIYDNMQFIDFVKQITENEKDEEILDYSLDIEGYIIEIESKEKKDSKELENSIVFDVSNITIISRIPRLDI